jgi:hypothetical protein
VRQRQRLGREQSQLHHHLSENRFHSVDPRQAAPRPGPLYLYPIQFDDGSVVFIAHHRRLDHLPERGLFDGVDEDAAQLVQRVGPRYGKHRDARADQLGEVVQEDQSPMQHPRRDVLQQVVLQGGHRRQASARRAGVVGGPGESVRRPARYVRDFFTLKSRHQSRSLDGVGGVVAELSLVVVPPREHLPLVGTSHAMQRPRRYAYYFFTLQRRHLLGSPHVLAGTVTQPVIITFTPAKQKSITTTPHRAKLERTKCRRFRIESRPRKTETHTRP